MSNHPSNEQLAGGSVDHKASPTHLYIVVDCKTENCRTAHVPTYLGEKGRTPTSVEYWVSCPLTVDLPNLRKDLRLFRFRRKGFGKKSYLWLPLGISQQARCTGDDEEPLSA